VQFKGFAGMPAGIMDPSLSNFPQRLALRLRLMDAIPLCDIIKAYTNIYVNTQQYFFFLLALQPPMEVVFYSPVVGFSLLAYEVS